VQAAPSLRPALGAVLQAPAMPGPGRRPGRIDPVLASVPGPLRPGTAPAGRWTASRPRCAWCWASRSRWAARTLAQRLVQRFGTPIDTPFPALTGCSPRRHAGRGRPGGHRHAGHRAPARAALQALAQAVADGRLTCTRRTAVETTLAACALPGIGDWTAQLIAMRTLAWPDAWPASDIALLNALGQTATTRDPAAGTAIAEAWRPWRGYAVFKLWLSLENPMTIHPHLQAQARIDTPLGP
jgi:AraC family transcriptional regulator of adaptative response / DNA-3-methyladenine glycosylase II